MIKHIPYTVIGGYLGAGKTTLLNNLLRDSQGLRLAVLVNDFGEINIDADLITSHDGETINLASGCICCSLADGFMTALARLRDHAERIDHIVVEASGVANPVKIGQYGAILRYDLDGVIVLADAEQIRTRAANKYVGETVIRQLKGADLLVLNKADLLDHKGLAEVHAWLAEVAPGVRIVEASYGRVPLAILLGVHHHERLSATLPNEQSDGGDEHHSALYETRSLVLSEPIERASLETLAVRLPEGVLRAKGFVQLAEDSIHRYLFQFVGRRWTLAQGEPWGDAAPETKLVFIGLPGSIELDAALQNAMHCATKSPTGMRASVG